MLLNAMVVLSMAIFQIGLLFNLRRALVSSPDTPGSGFLQTAGLFYGIFLILTALGAFFFQKYVGKFILLPLAHLAYCLASLNQVWFLRNSRKNLDTALLIQSLFLVVVLFLLSELYCSTVLFDTPLLFPIARDIVPALLLVWAVFECRSLRLNRVQTHGKLLEGVVLIGCLAAIARILALVFLQPVDGTAASVDRFLPGLVTLALMRTTSGLVFFFILIDQLNLGNAIKLIRTEAENERIRGLLTERDTLISSLVEHSRMLESAGLAAALTHEISQPVGALSMNVRALRNTLLAHGHSELVNQLIERIEGSSERLANTLGGLRSVFGMSRQDQAVASLAEIIETTLILVRPRAMIARIGIKVVCPDRVVIQSGPDVLRLVVLNLVANAIEAQEGTRQDFKQVLLTAQVSDGVLELMVSDLGPGVPSGFRSQLFGLKKSTKPQGNGLGLWLCRTALERWGGSIRLDDDYRSGARFVVVFPLCQREAMVSDQAMAIQ
jgi:signal transduction histidine kinase